MSRVAVLNGSADAEKRANEIKENLALFENLDGKIEELGIEEYFNDDLTGVPIPDKLDRQWYIDLAYKRLNDFGVRV